MYKSIENEHLQVHPDLRDEIRGCGIVFSYIIIGTIAFGFIMGLLEMLFCLIMWGAGQ